MIPLIINNQDILLDTPSTTTSTFQPTTPTFTLEALQSSESAFPSWSKTSPSYRRSLLNKLASLIRSRENEIRATIEEEVHMPPVFSKINVDFAVGLCEETGAVLTEALMGSIPVSEGESYAMVFKDPVGVVLGIAPWNAPIILGFRAVVAAVAAGNTVILKGSELSPRSHYLIASLFREAGFPPGVVNFLLHTPQDAASTVELLIDHPAVRKINFTGSTKVGSIIGAKAAAALKPAIMELGGKNFVIVLEDADIQLAAQQIFLGAMLNNGQICMSTDLVLAVESIAPSLISNILTHLEKPSTHRVIIPSTITRLNYLITDARSKGATIHQAPHTPDPSHGCSFPATVIENVTPDMAFYSTEAFGPVVGIVRVRDENEAIEHTNRSVYGLSSAIFTKNHFKAIQLAGRMRVGATHINSMTVHDEPTLPHGGMGESGFGRFGGKWGVEEFLVSRTVILNQ